MVVAARWSQQPIAVDELIPVRSGTGRPVVHLAQLLPSGQVLCTARIAFDLVRPATGGVWCPRCIGRLAGAKLEPRPAYQLDPRA